MELKTPLIGIYAAGALTILLLLLFEVPARPFTPAIAFWMYLTALLPGIGVGMLFDSNAKKAKEEFLKINFYEEKQ